MQSRWEALSAAVREGRREMGEACLLTELKSALPAGDRGVGVIGGDDMRWDADVGRREMPHASPGRRPRVLSRRIAPGQKLQYEYIIIYISTIHHLFAYLDYSDYIWCW